VASIRSVSRSEGRLVATASASQGTSGVVLLIGSALLTTIMELSKDRRDF